MVDVHTRVERVHVYARLHGVRPAIVGYRLSVRESCVATAALSLSRSLFLARAQREQVLITCLRCPRGLHATTETMSRLGCITYEYLQARAYTRINIYR